MREGEREDLSEQFPHDNAIGINVRLLRRLTCP